MPRVPDMPCSICGALLWRSRSSASEPVCRSCRSARRCGSTSGYRRGCRCDRCRQAQTESMRQYVAKRKRGGYPINFEASRRRIETTCGWCRVVFSARTDRNQRFCSLICANDAQGRRPAPMSAVRRHALARAAKAAVGSSGGNRVWVQGACMVCGTDFLSPGVQSRYCSQACRAKNRNRSFGVSWLDRMALFARDGWMCQICSEPVDYAADPRSDWYPTLDHILPRSRGGSHEFTNLRTAHRWCNSVRGDLSHYTDADLAA